MKKKISILPAREVELEFTDGTILKASFNMTAVAYMQEALFGYTEKIDMTEFGAIVLYGAIHVNHEEYTIEDAKALARGMAPASLNEIINEYTDSLGNIGSGELGDIQKKTMMDMLMKLAK